MPAKPLSFLTDEEWDATQRLMDAVNAHLTIVQETWSDRPSPPFIGISLATGACIDNTLYDTRKDCVRHLVSKDPFVFPLKLSPGGIGPKEAWTVLSFARAAKARGVAFHHEDPVVPQRLELMSPFVPRARLLLPGRVNGSMNRAERRRRR